MLTYHSLQKSAWREPFKSAFSTHSHQFFLRHAGKAIVPRKQNSVAIILYGKMFFIFFPAFLENTSHYKNIWSHSKELSTFRKERLKSTLGKIIIYSSYEKFVDVCWHRLLWSTQWLFRRQKVVEFWCFFGWKPSSAFQWRSLSGWEATFLHEISAYLYL